MMCSNLSTLSVGCVAPVSEKFRGCYTYLSSSSLSLFVVAVSVVLAVARSSLHSPQPCLLMIMTPDAPFPVSNEDSFTPDRLHRRGRKESDRWIRKRQGSISHLQRTAVQPMKLRSVGQLQSIRKLNGASRRAVSDEQH